MIYYRCKCGKHTSWSSMGQSPCSGCEECNTTLATSPEGHKEPLPHQWVKEFNPRNGERIDDCCISCGAKRPFSDEGLFQKGDKINANIWD